MVVSFGVRRQLARRLHLAHGVAGAVTLAVAVCAGGSPAYGAPLAGLPRAAFAPGSASSLAQAPPSLRASVRRAIGVPGAASGTSGTPRAVAGIRTELTASDATANDRFGWSVAIQGTTALVGAPSKNSNAGAAYVFVRSGSTWTQMAELTASDGSANDGFGGSLALSGSTLIVGATGKNSNAGAVYVFTGSGSTWTQAAELAASGGAANDFFGLTLSMQRSKLLVGAPGTESYAGAAYVFVGSGSTWTQQAKLVAPPAVFSNESLGTPEFGAAVAISGSTALVGAQQKSIGEKFSPTGAAYVFVHSRSGWSQVGPPLTAAQPTEQEFFGFAVAIHGPTAVITAALGNSGAGAAYVFVRSGTTWSQQAELVASDASAGDGFGASVALSVTRAGSEAFIGAPGQSSRIGAAYVFVQSGSAWSQLAELTPSGGAIKGELGGSLALSGSTALFGAPGQNSRTGAAYVLAGF
jgi:FG-GAP repeat